MEEMNTTNVQEEIAVSEEPTAIAVSDSEDETSSAGLEILTTGVIMAAGVALWETAIKPVGKIAITKLKEAVANVKAKRNEKQNPDSEEEVVNDSADGKSDK